MVTDGFLDQNAGSADHSFGRKRFVALLESLGDRPLEQQSGIFRQALQEYMQENAQRDDITLIGFRL